MRYEVCVGFMDFDILDLNCPVGATFWYRNKMPNVILAL